MMDLAPYNKQILDAAVSSIEAMEPIVLAGMFDSGIDFLYTRLQSTYIQPNQKKKIIYVDLSLCTQSNTALTEIAKVISTNNLDQFLLSNYVVVIGYLGQHTQTDSEFFSWMHSMLNKHRYHFSYVLFASSRWYKPNVFSSPVIEKIFTRNLVKILPRDMANTRVIISNYEERFGKEYTKDQISVIQKYSCGIPGIIKAFCLQIINNEKWETPDWDDPALTARLNGLSEDLVGVDQSKTYIHDFGYDQLVDLKPHLPTHVKNSTSELLLSMTPQEREIMNYFIKNDKRIITREEIAKILWGEQADERYSDWAIDQLISQIRSKLPLVSYQARIITKRREGYYFESG